MHTHTRTHTQPPSHTHTLAPPLGYYEAHSHTSLTGRRQETIRELRHLPPPPASRNTLLTRATPTLVESYTPPTFSPYLPPSLPSFLPPLYLERPDAVTVILHPHGFFCFFCFVYLCSMVFLSVCVCLSICLFWVHYMYPLLFVFCLYSLPFPVNITS